MDFLGIRVSIFGCLNNVGPSEVVKSWVLKEMSAHNNFNLRKENGEMRLQNPAGPI